MRIQLWSYNYDPEPTGIAPISRVWACTMRERGIDVDVVAAHPHYPTPKWGKSLTPYREVRDDVPILRLPLWVGRDTAAQRVRQEASFAASLTAASFSLETPDVIVAVSPSFPALGPAMLHANRRDIPWVLWLQDILPDGAVSTGLVESGRMLRLARRFEKRAYDSADKIAVLSQSFVDNLVAKGVEPHKLERIYNPASRPIASHPRPEGSGEPGRVLNMGNIGFSQNLRTMVEVFEADADLREAGASLIMAGDGVAADDVRQAITTDRVTITGIVDDARLGEELDRAKVALVSQHYDGGEFNVPSKLMNFMGAGLPVVASVAPDSEVARILNTSGGGWVTDSRRPAEAAQVLAQALRDERELHRRGAAALAFAQRNFSPSSIGDQFEDVLEDAMASRHRTLATSAA